MPDLNELLRWSITNSASAQGQAASAATSDDANAPASAPAPASTSASADSNDQQLSLKFNPASSTTHQAGSSALHPSDPYGYPDLSPASTPGPLTPTEGSNAFPSLGKSGPSASEILDLIMGRPDSAVMTEKMEFACDESQDVEQRVEALDDFEMVSLASIRWNESLTVERCPYPCLKLKEIWDPELTYSLLKCSITPTTWLYSSSGNHY